MSKLILGVALVASLGAGGWFGFWPWQKRQPVDLPAPTIPVEETAPTSSTVPEGTTVAPTTSNKPPTTNIPTSPSPKYAAMTSGTYTKTLVSGGLTRTYHIHIPIGYDPKKSYPLVFLFHGGNGTGETPIVPAGSKPAGERFLSTTGYDAKADLEKFIVVAPDGVGGNWNDGRGVTEPEKQGIDDVAFVKELVTSFKTTYNVDTKRIFATGISNGAMLSARLGCEASSLFAAIAPVSGALPVPVSTSCEASVSVVGIQGTNDPFSPIPDSDGTPAMSAKLTVGNQTLSIADTQSFWAKEIGCSATPTVVKQPVLVSDGTSVTQYTYPKCANGRSVVFYIVTAMGHSWPPNTQQATVAITGPSSKNIVATDVSWSFFAANPKR